MFKEKYNETRVLGLTWDLIKMEINNINNTLFTHATSRSDKNFGKFWLNGSRPKILSP